MRYYERKTRGTQRVCAARLPGLHWLVASPPTHTDYPTTVPRGRNGVVQGLVTGNKGDPCARNIDRQWADTVRPTASSRPIGLSLSSPPPRRRANPSHDVREESEERRASQYRTVKAARAKDASSLATPQETPTATTSHHRRSPYQRDCHDDDVGISEWRGSDTVAAQRRKRDRSTSRAGWPAFVHIHVPPSRAMA